VVYPSSRIVLIDIHGEYSAALGDIAKTFSISPRKGEEKLLIPYWSVSPDNLIDFLCGQVNEKSKSQIVDLIFKAKIEFIEKNSEIATFGDIDKNKLTPQPPIPFSLKKLWHDVSYDDCVTWDDDVKTIAA